MSEEIMAHLMTLNARLAAQEATINQLARQVAQLKNRADHTVRMAQTTMPINDASGTPTAQIQHNTTEGVHSDIYMVQQYGFFSNPPVGSAVTTVSMGGYATKKMVVGSSHTSRPQAQPTNAVGLFDTSGVVVLLAADGTAKIQIGGLTILEVGIDGIQINGTVTATGDIQSTGGNIISGSGVELEHHTHTVGSATSSPPLG
jgi:phage gp45-like